MPQSKKDISGEKYWRLTAIKFHSSPKGRDYWLWKCDCGKEIVSRKDSPSTGSVKSCGCLNIEVRKSEWNKKRLATLRVTHGLTHSKIYEIWSSMHRRCSPVSKHYKNDYFKRGIRVCDRWKTFELFYDDMFNDYITHHSVHGDLNTSLDRINNDEGYYKSNCRFATRKQQINNRRTTVMLTYKGETQPLSVWAEIKGVPRKFLYQRIKQGFVGDAVIDYPKNKRR